MKMNDIAKKFRASKSGADERISSSTIEGGRREGEAENPFLAARRTWNDQATANAATRQMFQLFGILGLLVGLAGVGGVIYIGSQSRFIPYVVEVDKLGQQHAVGPASRASPVDTRVVNSSVATWITDVRTVTPDIALQRKAIFRSYSMLTANDPATAKTNEWFNSSEDRNPSRRAEKETVSVEITSVIPQTPETWQVDWIETTRDRQGTLTGSPQRWRALVTVYVAPPTPATTEEDMRNNPLGVRVRDFSWSKQL